MSAPGRRAPQRRRGRDRNGGQSLVEFALVLPVFLLTLVALIEFGFAFNAYLSVSFASRNATVIATETCGDGTCGHEREYAWSDCEILWSVERDITQPAVPSQIQSVDILWTDTHGEVMGDGQAYTTWTRTGTTACNDDGLTVPYTRTRNEYPHEERCSILAGCPTIPDYDGDEHTTVDTIGVRITYNYYWHTPYAVIFNLLPGAHTDLPPAGGLVVVRSAEMRMEPTQ